MAPFDSILNRDEIFVVGGGPSLVGFNFEPLQSRDVIVTNRTILDLPSAKYFITVDYSFLKKVDSKCFRESKATKIFVACTHFSYIREKDGKITDTRYNIVYDLSPFDVIIKSKQFEGIGFEFKDFRNGLNSGFCALQLAVLLGYKKIYLLGIDLDVVEHKSKIVTHYHKGYGQNWEKFKLTLETYYNLFVEGLRELHDKTSIEVISLSEISKLNQIISYEDPKVVLA